MLTSTEKSLVRQIAKDFFVGKPVKIGIRAEGQRISNACFLLGCSLVGKTDVEALLHEMGHFSEREPEKLLKKPVNGWGFSHGKYWQIAGKCGFEPQTDAQVQREARVWGYQLSLHRYYGLNPDVRKMVDCAKYLPAFGIYEYKIPEIKDLGYTERENAALDILAKEVEEKSLTKFTFESFKENWELRAELLK